MRRRSWFPVLCALAVGVPAAIAGPAAASAVTPGPSACVNGYDTPPIAHPSRERFVHLACNGPIYPADVTVDQPAHGTVTKGTTLSYVYEPADGFTGTDHFTLHPTGAGHTWAAVQFDVTVSTTANTGPQCSLAGGTPEVRAGASRSIALGGCFDDEGDPVTLEIATPPAHGTLGAVTQAPAAPRRSPTRRRPTGTWAPTPSSTRLATTSASCPRRRPSTSP